MTAIFITGTDTGIGKTWVSLGLAELAIHQGLSVAYYKPIQTGTPEGQPPEDPAFLNGHLGDKISIFNRYCFVPPVTPSVADTHQTIQLEPILKDVSQLKQQFDVVLVEGAGGLMVPITPDLLIIDLIQALDLTVLLVGHCRLGGINQALLSIEALQSRQLKLLGLMLNFYPQHLPEAPLAVQTLIPTLRSCLGPSLPIWTSLLSEDLPPRFQSNLPPEFFVTNCNVSQV